MATVKALTTETYETDAVESQLPVVIDFYADWCNPCKMIAPIIENLVEKYEGKVNFFKINIDEQRKLALSNKVMSIPTLFFMKDGKIVERISGAVPQATLEQKIDSLL